MRSISSVMKNDHISYQYYTWSLLMSTESVWFPLSFLKFLQQNINKSINMYIDRSSNIYIYELLDFEYSQENKLLHQTIEVIHCKILPLH